MLSPTIYLSSGQIFRNISQISFKHIFEAHGDFNPHNLLENIAYPDYKTINVKSFDTRNKQW
jgi:hypothetical protein